MRAELALAAVLMSGCSMMTMERASSSHRSETTPRCTATWRPLAVDAVTAVPWAVLGAMLVDDGNQERGVVITSALAAGFLASAVYGWIHRGECLDAFDAHDRYLRSLAAPPPQAGPPPG